MKTISTREFFEKPTLIKSLRPGHALILTDGGKIRFTVAKVGKRPRRTREDLEREARQICPRNGPKVNFTALIKEMKGSSKR